MANLRITAAVRNGMLDSLRTAMDAGAGAAILEVYSGTQPANADTALSGNTLLGTLTFTDPAAGSASSGTLTFSAITQDSSADATGTATFVRVKTSAGTTIFDADAGTSGTTFILNTASIVAGGPITITSATLSIPAV